jgi:2'-5' RNA ligase
LHETPAKDALYFLAVLPPAPLAEEIMAIQRAMCEQYNSKAALRSPPHITLHMPFQWKEKKEDILIERFQEFASRQRGFTLKLENFGCFEPRVIFVMVTPSARLETLHNDLYRCCKIHLGLFNARYKNLPFHPHLTIAFRDLKKIRFYEAWKEFSAKPFFASFAVNRIALLKHDGNQWNVSREFDLA